MTVVIILAVIVIEYVTKKSLVNLLMPLINQIISLIGQLLKGVN